MSLKFLKSDAIVNIGIGSGFVQRIQQILLYIAKDVSKEKLEEYKNLVAGNEDLKLKQLSNKVEFKTFAFYGKPKNQIYNNVQKKRMNIWKIDNLDTKSESNRLVKELKHLLSIKN